MKKRAGIYAVVALMVASGWYAFAYRPTLERKAALDGKIAQAQSQLDDFDATIMSLPSYLETERSLLESKQGLQSKLYGKDEILELFRRLREDARIHQFMNSINSIRNFIGRKIPSLDVFLQLNFQFLEIRITVNNKHLNGIPAKSFCRFETSVSGYKFIVRIYKNWI